MRAGVDGSTLVELLVTLAVIGLVTGSLVKMFSSMAISHTTRAAGADLQQSVRAVIDLMSRELRMAGFSSLRPTGFGITNAEGEEVTFTVDWDDNGYLTESHGANPDIREESDIISYRLDADQHRLVRVTAVGTSSESTQSILGGAGDPMRVMDLRFSYFNQLGQTTSRIADISSVGVAITADLPAGIKGRQARVYQTRINCRNLQL